MPIGKNAIKRVEGSTKKEIPTAKEVVEIITAPAKPTAKKPTVKATPKATAKAATSKAAMPGAPKATPKPAKPAAKVAARTATAPKANKTTEEKKDGFVRINIGAELPIYLL